MRVTVGMVALYFEVLHPDDVMNSADIPKYVPLSGIQFVVLFSYFSLSLFGIAIMLLCWVSCCAG